MRRLRTLDRCMVVSAVLRILNIVRTWQIEVGQKTDLTTGLAISYSKV